MSRDARVSVPIALRRAAELERQLDLHCAALDACRRCGTAGGETGVLPVLPQSRRPRAMLVGQAPGKTEVIDRRPFAGRAGKTLFRWLAQAGVDEATVRERVFIGAITRCYPGPSPSGRGDRVPSPRERALCADWLDAELALIRPPLVIPVGRLAIDRFLGPVPLERLVGRRHRIAHVGGTSVAIPLPHPSGASSWVHERDHRALLDRALVLLGESLAEAGVIDDAGATGADRDPREHARRSVA